MGAPLAFYEKNKEAVGDATRRRGASFPWLERRVGQYPVTAPLDDAGGAHHPAPSKRRPRDYFPAKPETA
jgi:hypothetical protein